MWDWPHPDRDEMVYLESIRYARRVAFRNVVSGQRVPMELTSLGRAYLSTLPVSSAPRPGSRVPAPSPTDLERLERRDRRGGGFRQGVRLLCSILAARGHRSGCTAITSDMAYAVNVSVLTTDPVADVVRRLAPKLLILRDDIRLALERATDAASP
jgi:DNA-binding IclR family transcriptional regulator